MRESLCSNCNHGNTSIDYPCNICVNYDQWKQEPEDEATTLRQLLTAATERAEKAEAQRDQMREALERIVASDTGEWFDAIRDKFVYCGKCQDKEYEASKALEEAGDE